VLSRWLVSSAGVRVPRSVSAKPCGAPGAPVRVSGRLCGRPGGGPGAVGDAAGLACSWFRAWKNAGQDET